MEILAIARVAHEANRAYCATLGDMTQPAWDDAPQWQRDSAISGVAFLVNRPDAGAGALHENWRKEKIEAGWTYGPVKHPEAKQHPCLVPFDELPREQQAKDFLFGAVVHALREA